ncbi:MAG: serine hydrolase [Candidatus Aminicenantes bacterium]|nr:serine hydrolase [Candidatus Aminicenantes bacterium]
MLRKIGFSLIIIFLISLIVLSGCKKNEAPDEPEFNSLAEEIDYLANQYVRVGAMIGVINKQQEKLIFSYGTKSINTTEPPDSNTVFDIGSITKTFTATLLSDIVLKGVIYLTNTVGNYLPADQVIMPSSEGVEITFEHLATHTSGIPRKPHEEGSTYPLPEGYDPLNPYAAYTTEHIYDYLTNYCTLEFTPGTYWGYSNTGMGLLGHTLGIIDGTSYENILIRDIFNALDMQNSSLFLTEQQMSNQALGHDRYINIVPFYTANDIFQGCGMIKSSLNDMFKYLEANMGLIETPLKDAMERAHQRTPGIWTGSLGYIGLAWYIFELDDGQEVTYSGGDTNGHSAYIGFNKSESTGVIVLLNCSVHDGTNLNLGAAIMKAINKY